MIADKMDQQIKKATTPKIKKQLEKAKKRNIAEIGKIAKKTSTECITYLKQKLATTMSIKASTLTPE